jgi:hypothetical protein
MSYIGCKDSIFRTFMIILQQKAILFLLDKPTTYVFIEICVLIAVNVKIMIIWLRRRVVW